MGNFQMYQDREEKVRFRLIATNGQIILKSQGYKSKQSGKKGIEAVIQSSRLDKNFERKETKDGHYYFTLKSSNGLIVGTSEIYASKAALELGIKSVTRYAAEGKKKLA